MLKRVSIQNFKSLKDVTLDLQKVNLLIGPNNSGKTNFLKALEFMSTRKSNLKIEVPEKFIFRGQRDKYIANNNSVVIHLIHIGPNTFGAYEHNILRKTNTDNGNYYVIFSNAFVGDSGEIEYRVENLLDPSPELGNFKTLKDIHLKDLKIYKPDPNKLTQSSMVGKREEIVNADCSNLVGFLDLMLGKYRRTVFNKIEIDLHHCIPEFDEIKLDDAPYVTDAQRRKFEGASFKRIGLGNNTQDVSFWADELSEGTLYFLALLCIINQPNPPKLLLLEEPEKGIHPRRIREVMDFIFRLAEEKDVQIILTTHNENVLNEFTSIPESVFVFEKDEEGATHVKNLLTDIIEPSRQRSKETGTKEIDFTSNLGENWMYGLLGGVPEEAL